MGSRNGFNLLIMALDSFIWSENSKTENSFKLGKDIYQVHTIKQTRMPPGSAPGYCHYISLLSRTRLPTRRSTSFPPLRTFQKNSQSPRHTGRRDREGLIDMRTACFVILAQLAHKSARESR